MERLPKQDVVCIGPLKGAVPDAIRALIKHVEIVESLPSDWNCVTFDIIFTGGTCDSYARVVSSSRTDLYGLGGDSDTKTLREVREALASLIAAIDRLVKGQDDGEQRVGDD